MKFGTVKKGYNVAEVDDYVLEAEQALTAQKDRITALKKKIASLEKELEIYHEKKELIIAALSEAVKKSEQIERQANQKYDLEIQRLRLFHARWTEHYRKLFQRFPTSVNSTDEFNNEMDRILKQTEWNEESGQDRSVESLYDKEKARLGYVDAEQVDSKRAGFASSLTPLDRIKKYLDGTANEQQAASPELPSETGVFSLEEALHPKQDLVGIMKDLGLILDE